MAQVDKKSNSFFNYDYNNNDDDDFSVIPYCWPCFQWSEKDGTWRSFFSLDYCFMPSFLGKRNVLLPVFISVIAYVLSVLFPQCIKCDCACTCQPPECDSCNCLCFEIRIR